MKRLKYSLGAMGLLCLLAIIAIIYVRSTSDGPIEPMQGALSRLKICRSLRRGLVFCGGKTGLVRARRFWQFSYGWLHYPRRRSLYDLRLRVYMESTRAWNPAIDTADNIHL